MEGGKPEMARNTGSEASEIPGEIDEVPGKVSSDDFLAEALRIAHEIRRAARSFQEGVSWNTVAYYAAGSALEVGADDPALL